jgi:hypothetical protein
VVIPVGLITAFIHAGDVDCDQIEQPSAIVAILNKHFGSRWCAAGMVDALCCSTPRTTAPIRKFRAAWIDKEGDKGAFEFLAGSKSSLRARTPEILLAAGIRAGRWLRHAA